MIENLHGRNYELAKAEADKVDEQIIEVLQAGHSFRVEAGAGSGKTYSLNKVIEWIQSNKWAEYSRKKQNVICITYTNAAVNVIAERLSKDSFILPSTIHSFAWNAIKQYQSFLINIVTTDPDFLPDEGDFLKITEVTYTLGHRYKENGIQYLYHDDVLKLFCTLLDNAKFRRVFLDKYPLILIDEYQDSYSPIIERFIKYFIAEEKGPQFGFFGDAWQTIYQSNKACGVIEHDKLKVIKKGSNFRSAPKIVDLLNEIRPDDARLPAAEKAVHRRDAAQALHRRRHRDRRGEDAVGKERRAADHRREDEPGRYLFHQRVQREYAALAVIIRAHGDEHILDSREQRDRPDDERERTEDKVLVHMRDAAVALEDRFHHVQRRCADVAVHNADRHKEHTEADSFLFLHGYPDSLLWG